MAERSSSPPSISIDQLTEAALAGVHRAIDARGKKDLIHGPILVGIIAWPDARAGGLQIQQPSIPTQK